MRTLKFRAWDGKKFGYVQIQANMISWPNNMWMEHTDIEGAGRRFVNVVAWEQYTGLKDRNGTDIYEGDILKTSGDVLWRVDFSEKICGFGVTSLTDNGAHDELYPYHLAHGWMLIKKPEVIGNVWEHPDLLPDAQKRGE